MGSVGNLGNYQRLVSLAKATDGPVKLAIYVVAGSVAVGTIIGTAAGPTIKKGLHEATQTVKRIVKPAPLSGHVYTVFQDAEGDTAPELRAGDQFRVIEQHGDAIVIELLGDAENPYVKSGELLESVSDFKLAPS
ncbi:hypothetical protein ASG06_05045 [Rathayibacter sp. Leaf185]|nr:hypothetical protein ASF42_05035 [Rathayibacter sp. Leaf294]KQS13762.1 hypothetical protein ASG06_05045 [Rathayibacter sp. Leaf185]